MYPTIILSSLLSAICFVYSGECSEVGRDLYICPEYSDTYTMAFDSTRTALPNIFGVATLNIRVPESGMLPETITCILIEDQIHDGTGGEVTIMDGGILFNFVEIHITSNIWRGLNYRVQVYTNAAKTTTTSTTTTSSTTT